jgi:leader peptidase (prepilin peptidase)/N-methyltransferase
MIYLATLIPFFLCWGSFLNVLGYRLVRGLNIAFPRSNCPHCTHTIAWYDLIPVFSWIALRGKCRECKKSISPLYPFIEILTAVVMTGLYLLMPPAYWFAYFIFFSALIITIRTDIELMLISRFVTLFLIPAMLLLATMHFLPIGLVESALGIIFGYLFLYIMAWSFALITGRQGMGAGDLELLAFIGAVVGPFGVWITLLISTTTGSFLGLTYMALRKPGPDLRIPFGPFLAFGAIMYVLFQCYFANLITY